MFLLSGLSYQTSPLTNITDLIYGACFVQCTEVIVSGMKSSLLTVKQNNTSQTHAAQEGCSALWLLF